MSLSTFLKRSVKLMLTVSHSASSLHYIVTMYVLHESSPPEKVSIY